jgi:CheY-like chemotaxis protein
MPNGILIVDDNSAVRSLIRAQFAVSGLTVCGEAADGLDAIEKAPF